MPNTPVRAAAEGMPAIIETPIGRFSRRALLGALASVPALGAAAAAIAVATPPKVFPDFGRAAPDPLLDAITAFRTSMADFDAHSPADDDAADAYAEATYFHPMTVLEEWEAPAMTHRGAVEAIRLAADETAMFASSPLVPSLLAAALAYFEAQS